MIDPRVFLVHIPLGIFSRRGRWLGTRVLTDVEREAEWHVRMGRHRAQEVMARRVREQYVDQVRIVRRRRRKVARAKSRLRTVAGIVKVRR